MKEPGEVTNHWNIIRSEPIKKI